MSHPIIPPAREQIAMPDALAAPAGRVASGRTGNRTVLVVEDDSGFRRTMAAMLHLAGFKTLTAANGLEALEKIQQNSQIRAVVMDLLMPVMDGEETCRQIRTFWEDLPVILMSGFDLGADPGRFGNPPPNFFLKKPFSLDALASALATVLP